MFIGSTMRAALLVACCTTLGCDDDHAAPLIAQLESTDVEVRRATVQALNELQGKNVTAALASAVADSDSEVRELAIHALGQRGDQAIAHLPQLEPMLKHADADTRLAAAFAIRKIDSTSELHVPTFQEALEAGDLRALLELGNVGSDSALDDAWAVPKLIELLQHRNPRLRALSALTLGQLGSDANEVTTALQKAADDPQTNVRKMAQQALTMLKAARP